MTTQMRELNRLVEVYEMERVAGGKQPPAGGTPLEASAAVAILVGTIVVGIGTVTILQDALVAGFAALSRW